MGFQFNQVAILGVGLIGGSLGLALRERKIAKTVIGLGRNHARLALAKKKGAIDQWTTDWKSGISKADVVVICIPVRKIIPTFKKLILDFPKGCVVTDVGSTKKSIVEGIEKILLIRKGEVFFVGSHPMAGSEQFGIEAAKKDLYERSVCLITPSKKSNRKAVSQINNMWESVGCKVLEISPDIHDRSVAAISHLPHVLAVALVNTIARLDGKNRKLGIMAASGFRDTTRIASSHPEIWTDICLENQKSVLEAIHLFEKELKEFKEYIRKGNTKKVHKKFQSAKKYRDNIYHSQGI